MENDSTLASRSNTNDTTSSLDLAKAHSNDTMTSSLYSMLANQAIDRLSDQQPSKEQINYCPRIKTRTGKVLCADGIFRDLKTKKQEREERLLSTELFSWTYNLQRVGVAHPGLDDGQLPGMEQEAPTSVQCTSSPQVSKGQSLVSKSARVEKEVSPGGLKRRPSLVCKLSSAARELFHGGSVRANKKLVADESYESLRQQMIEWACWEREHASPRKVRPEGNTTAAHDSAVYLEDSPNTRGKVNKQYPSLELVPQPLRVSKQQEQRRQAFMPSSPPSRRLSSRKRVDTSRKSWMPPDHGHGEMEIDAGKTQQTAGRVIRAQSRSSGRILVLAEQMVRKTCIYGGDFF
ncbi:hypothetical protein BDY17DRAFT_324284 [Neohortaea acidophila]|uniref:Uncharacterized protein n=1 Tax=Neohortaea acidophila TaxID=245834 RepID=A0A6A6PUA0_9PEZI|nr:uncharacterized protein BDY17DRAFT_324284 [Neohortaea acidophila]KAF2483562.1 hypothetical protein BDY17DRAFT_324284 [Neohortaea acidophila]